MLSVKAREAADTIFQVLYDPTVKQTQSTMLLFNACWGCSSRQSTVIWCRGLAKSCI